MIRVVLKEKECIKEEGVSLYCEKLVRKEVKFRSKECKLNDILKNREKEFKRIRDLEIED